MAKPVNAFLAKKQIAHQIEIEMERRQAAEEALWLAIVALNETDGINLGRERIVRFADKLQAVSEEYDKMKREDSDYAGIKLQQRINQIMGERKISYVK